MLPQAIGAKPPPLKTRSAVSPHPFVGFTPDQDPFLLPQLPFSEDAKGTVERMRFRPWRGQLPPSYIVMPGCSHEGTIVPSSTKTLVLNINVVEPLSLTTAARSCVSPPSDEEQAKPTSYPPKPPANPSPAKCGSCSTHSHVLLTCRSRKASSDEARAGRPIPGVKKCKVLGGSPKPKVSPGEPFDQLSVPVVGRPQPSSV